MPASAPCLAGFGVVPSIPGSSPAPNRTSVPGEQRDRRRDDQRVGGPERAGDLDPVSGPTCPSTSTGTLVTYSLRIT